MKTLTVVARSKRWWDDDLTKQLKKVRRVRRGGRKKNGGKEVDRGKKLRRWRKVAEKMKKLVEEKREKCWRTFCEEHGQRDPWEIVRWAKEPWRLKTRMRNLRDVEGRTLETDEDKSEGLVRDLFRWNDEMVAERTLDSTEYGRVEIDDMEGRVREAPMGTRNSSAPRPDGISYRLIKAVRDTRLGEELIKEVALHLLEGTIPAKWKEMRVVLIPKPRRDVTLTKNW